MSTEEEYRAVRDHAGLIDWSTQSLLEIRGADRALFLHNLLTQNIKELAPGSGAHAALVTPNAKLLAELLVLADEQAHWLLTDRSRAETVLKTLERYVITEDVSLHDRSADVALLALQGPDTATILRHLDCSLALQPGTHTLCTVDDTTIRLVAWSLAGESGVIMVVPTDRARSVWERVRAQGATPVGWEAFNIVRLEAGIPWFGIDMNEECLLPETGLERTAVSDTKGCYVGQEVIARLQTYGSVSRKLMGMVCEGPTVPAPGDAIHKDGQPLGEVTSACASPALKQPIALGYVKRPQYQVGATVEIRHATRPLVAHLVERPLIRHQTSPARQDHEPGQADTSQQ